MVVVKKSKSITEQISERQYVTIAHNYPNGVCENPQFIPLLKEKLAEQNIIVTNLITHEEDNTASCALYGKSPFNCESILYDDINPGNVACVLGYDYTPSNKSVKKINSFNVSDDLINTYLEMI